MFKLVPVVVSLILFDPFTPKGPFDLNPKDRSIVNEGMSGTYCKQYKPRSEARWRLFSVYYVCQYSFYGTIGINGFT